MSRLEQVGTFTVMRRFFAGIFLRGGGVSSMLSSGLFYLMTTALVGVISSYRVWQRKEITRIHDNGMVIDTPVGPVEYQVAGHGPAVIYAHGTPGGYDQGIAFKEFLDPDNC